MSKETDKFVKDYKATLKRLKELSLPEAVKLKKTVQANLDKTWTAEDKMKDEIQKARMGGITGKKAADFIKEKDVAKALKDWKDALKTHHDAVDELKQLSQDAGDMNGEMGKRVGAAEKDMKKTGGMSDIKAMAQIKEAKKTLPDLKKTAAIYGSLKSHEVMYGRNLQRSIEAIVKDALKGVDPKEFPKGLTEAQRKKTLRTLGNNEKKIEAYCAAAMKHIEAKDVDRAEKLLKKAQPLNKELEALNAEGTTVAKKMKKELKTAKDGKEVAALVKKLSVAYKKCDEMIEKLEDEVSKLEKIE